MIVRSKNLNEFLCIQSKIIFTNNVPIFLFHLLVVNTVIGIR